MRNIKKIIVAGLFLGLVLRSVSVFAVENESTEEFSEEAEEFLVQSEEKKVENTRAQIMEEEYKEENIETAESDAADSDYSYVYDEDTKVLTISGNGPLPDFRYDKFYDEVLAPWRFVIQKAVKIVIGDGITGIGDYAFYRCESVKEIVIGNNVVSIGKCAFRKCYDLQKVTIGKCVREIEEYAFQSGSDETPVSLYITDLVAWCKIKFADGFSNPISGKVGKGFLYLNGEKVTEVVVPDSITEIKYCTFAGMKNLRKVVLHNKVTRIGVSAFGGCSSLKDIKIPESVISIGGAAFAGCSSLTDIVFPEAITGLEENMF